MLPMLILPSELFAGNLGCLALKTCPYEKHPQPKAALVGGIRG